MSTPTRQRLSMLRSYTVADAITVGNALCGTICLFLCIDYLAFGDVRRVWVALSLLPIALADVISFGVAPAVLGYTLGLRGGWDQESLWFGSWQIGPATLHPLVLVYVASGSAMISTIRIPKP